MAISSFGMCWLILNYLMPIPFPQYVRIKDNYCCFYLGSAPEYVVALRLLKPQIEEQLPGINFWIGCHDDLKYLLADEPNVVTASELPSRKDDFAYIRELRNDTTRHSVLALMEESDLKIKPVTSIKERKGGLCLICPEGIEPTKPMKQEEVQKWKLKAAGMGYTPMVLGSDIHYSLQIDIRPGGKEKLKYIDEASWVIGVENEYILLGATKGIKTTLIRTGIGHTLFKRLSPGIEVV